MRTFNIVKFLSLILLIGLSTIEGQAQTGVSINATGTAPDAQAIIDISSTTKGAFLPRMTTGESATLAASLDAGDDGMIIYDVTLKGYKYWDGALLAWQTLITTPGVHNDLDGAYDQGGAGAGRVITADAGAVDIQGADGLLVAGNVGIGTTSQSQKLIVSSGTAGDANILIQSDIDNNDEADHPQLQFSQDGGAVTGFLGYESNVIDDNVLYLSNQWTDAAGDVRIRTQDSDRLTVDGVGNVGIGTTGPLQEFHVIGTTRVSTLADASGAVVTSDVNGDLSKTSYTGSATDVLLGTGSFGPASAFEDDDWYQTLSTNTPTAISDWIYTNGRVGIGVGASSNPNAPLEVAATGAGNPANNSIMASNPTNAAGNDAIITTRVAGTSAGDPFFSMDISGEAGWSLGVDNDHGNRFKIAPSWNNLSTSTAITIKDDGNVGIGTDDPDQKLQANGIIRSRGSYMVDIDGANGSGPRIAWGTTANPYDMMNLGGYAGINNLETTSRDFRIGSNSAFNAFYLEASTGEIGIGNNAPGYDLDVTGNTRTTGDFYGDLHVDDTRDDNFPPTTYDNEVAFDFKRRSAIGVNGSGTYSGMMTFAPWGDDSGDASHQINFNEGGLYWRQGQPNSASWGTWYKILTVADGLPTGSGTTNYLARWTPDGNTLGIGTTYDNGTNVGLGTTSPATKLDVRGQATFGNAIVPNSSTDDNIINVMSGSNGIGNQNGISFYENTSGFSMSLGYDGLGSGATNAMRFYSDAEAPLMTIENGGEVGIGTTTPDAHLNVGNPTGGNIMATREGSPTSGQTLGSLLFDAQGTSVSTTDGSAVVRGLAAENQGNSNKGGHLTFLTKATGSGLATAALERMRVQANGNVGIGTTNATSKLTVAGGIGRTAHNNGHLEGSYNNVGANSAQTNPIYTIGQNYNPDAAALINMYGIGYSHTNASFITDPGPDTWGMYVAADGDARIWLGASNSAHSYFNTGGNVGINKTTPTAELHVDGATNTEVLVESDDSGASTISAYGVGQGTGRLYVGQSSTYGGGIEYNGDNSPITTGAGADYITLFRRSAGVDSWTARNRYLNNDWEFREDVDVNGYLTVGNPNTGSTVKKGKKTFVDGSTINIYNGTGNYNYTWNMGQLDLPPGASSITVKAITYNMTGYRRDTDESISIRAKVGGNVAGWTLTSSWTFGGGSDQYYDWNYAEENLNWSYTSGQTVQFQLVEENETCFFCNNDYFTLYNIEVTVFYEYTTSPQAGTILAEGRIYANSTVEMGDMAEYFEVVDGDVQAGHLVSLIPGSENQYTLSEKGYDPYILGVVSENPSVVLNSPDVGPPVALAGRVKVKLVSGMPLVKSGDFITSSPQRGLGMKARKPGTVIGYAVANQITGQNNVEILLQPGRFYYPVFDNESDELPRQKFSSGK